MTKAPVSAEGRLDSLSREKAELVELLLERHSRQTRTIKPYAREATEKVCLPTSWAQRRLWFIDQLEGGSSAYYLQLALRMRGFLDPQALRRTLDTIVKRHEALRTVFEIVDGSPKQTVAAEGRFALKAFDLGDREEADREAQVKLAKLEEAQEKFDLRAGPLIRGRLLRLRTDEHVLLVTMHHIVSDGWSLGVLSRELSELYTAYQTGKDSPLSPLPIQYADYAQWQQEWLQGEMLETQIGYWRERLEGAAPELNLPTDRLRPAVQSFRGRNLEVALDAQLSAALNALAISHGMTLFMVLYAAWAILLSKLSGQEDVVIGTPVANRRRPEFEGLIGFLVNTLVLRVEVQRDVPVKTFFERIKELTLGAYDHQDIPFEQLVELIKPQRSLSRNPVFQVMLVLQNTPKSELSLSGLTVTPERGARVSSLFDLLLSLEQRGDRIVGVVNYATDLFDERTIERWFACFVVLLKEIAGRPQARIEDLRILPAEERCDVVERFNATRTDYLHEQLIHERFEEQVRATPDARAIEYEGQWLSYAELNRKANQLARYLVNEGVGPDGLVGICVGRSLEMVIGLLAVLKAGGAYVPLDPDYPIERLRYMLEDAAPQVVLTHEELKPLLPSMTGQVLILDAKLKAISGYVDENLSSAELGLTAQNRVYVIYTSGSTGRPKGTAMSHAAMVNLIEWHRRALPLREESRVLQFAALSFDVSFQETFSTLCTGGTLVLVDEWVRRDARELIEVLNRRSIERLFLPPLLLQSLAECFRESGTALGNLKDVITAGEPLRISAEIVALFKHLGGCRLHNHYGPTETHVVTALTLSGDPGQWPELPAIGRPIANTQIYVLDRQRQPVPIGVTGEIYIGGANLARGYLNRPELTAERFVPDPISASAESRLYATGDLGRWRADGVLEYRGRNDDQVKIRGFRIELGEIEAQLARHTQVREAAVIVREDTAGDKRLVAYVTGRDQVVAVEDLRAHLTAALPEHMVPSAFVLLESLPLTPSGKLNRRALPVPDPSAYAVREYEPAHGEVEQEVARIWQELLQIERVGRQDNFFELGGHSFLVVKALARIRERLGESLRVADVYRSPTLQALAARIRGREVDDPIIELSTEAVLDRAIVLSPGTPCASPKAILLTGGSGFVGRFLLAQLLEDTDAVVYCLTRASSSQEASERIRATLVKWDLWRDEYQRRLVGVAGDIRRPCLGVDVRTDLELCQNVDAIYHCATSMNHLETYVMAKSANVGSVREVLRLATRGKPKVINYVSTLGVFGPSPSGALRTVDEETSIAPEIHRNSQGYVASKWVAEAILLAARQQGIPCNIFRLGLVWADSQRGRFDELQRSYRILKSCLLSGVGIENYEYAMSPVPVDHVARATVFLATRYHEGGRTFHIASRGRSRALLEWCNEVADLGLELLPCYDWICRMKALHQQGRTMPVVPLIEFAFDLDKISFDEHSRRAQSTHTLIDCSRTRHELDLAGISIPSLSSEFLRRSLQSMVERDPELRDLGPDRRRRLVGTNLSTAKG